VHITRQKLSKYLFWIGLPILVLLILTLPVPGQASVPQERSFHVEASRFAYQPSVLKVNQGDRVTIDLVAEDVTHGLSVDGYNLEITADPGQPTRLTFVADHSGAFRLRCSVTCGPMHPFMIGKLQVGSNDLYLRGVGLALLLTFAALWKVRR
jgi:heme/copper-type cytochrome/quinol oxidase subunit 2